MPAGKYVLLLGSFGVLLTFFQWWTNVIKEAHAGDHTPVVQLHLRYGMILFIASEVMFFVGWFWAFFDFSLFPSNTRQGDRRAMAAQGARSRDQRLRSAAAQHADPAVLGHHGDLGAPLPDPRRPRRPQEGPVATIALGLLFTSIQAYEYSTAPFAFGTNTYGSAFYMATGFHGFHVIIGTIFLIVCLMRAYAGDFTPRQHFGFEAAAWYWHFVDVVWLFLFVAIYVWGNWGFPTH